MPASPALRRQGQEDHEFKARLSYISKLCLKKPRAESAAQW
jgi:hypothetical protein